MNGTGDKKSWGLIVSKINNMLHPSNMLNVHGIAMETGLTENEVRSFLPFTNCRELIQEGQLYYMLNSEPKKVKMRQAILLVMEAEKRFNDVEWMSSAQIKERIPQVFKYIDAEKAVRQLWQLCDIRQVERKGVRPNYLYRTLDEPSKSQQSARSKKTYTEQILEIADVVERLEARVDELEKENMGLTKKVSFYERQARSMVKEFED